MTVKKDRHFLGGIPNYWSGHYWRLNEWMNLDMIFETLLRKGKDTKSIAVTHSFKQNLITHFTNGSLIEEGAPAMVIGPRKKYCNGRWRNRYPK